MGHLVDDEPSYTQTPMLIRRQSDSTETSVEWNLDESDEQSTTWSIDDYSEQKHRTTINTPCFVSSKTSSSILVLTPPYLRYHTTNGDDESDSEDVFGSYDIGHDADDETDNYFFGPGVDFVTGAYEQQRLHQMPLRREVTFTTIQVRTYAVTVGDINSGIDSCPLSLDWEHAQDESFDINHYEKQFHHSASQSTPQRLTVHERRRRIALVKGWDERLVRNLEIERAMSNLESIHGRHSNSRSKDYFLSSSSQFIQPKQCPVQGLRAPPSSPREHCDETQERDQQPIDTLPQELTILLEQLDNSA